MSDDRKLIKASEAQGPFFVGVDVGGTSVKIGLVDDLGRTLSWLAVPTEVPKGPDAAVERMSKAVHEAIQQAGLEPSAVARVGLGSAGTMDIPAGKLVRPGNLKGWEDYPIRDKLANACGFPVTFANDAAAAAYGEYWVGSGRDFASLMLITLGTGVGCGVIIDGKSLDGVNSHGCECGHIIVNPLNDARWCNCGHRGHLEAYTSATGVTRRTQERLDAGLISSLNDRIAAGEPLTPKMIAEEAGQGDALAMDVVMETARWLGIGLVTLMHTIDPSGILIGGAMTFDGKGSDLGEKFLGRIKEEIDNRAFPLLATRIKLDFASLGGDAGYLGAAGMAREDFITQK